MENCLDYKDEDDFYSKNKYIEEPWSIIKSYFKNKYLQQLVRHQIESYNEFVNHQLYKTIEMFNPLKVVSQQDFIPELKKNRLEIYINFKNICMYRPEIHENNGATKLMFPNKARLRNFTYASNLNVDIHIQYIIRKGENLEQEESIINVLPKIHIGKFPIMLKSSLCVLNQYKHMDNKNIPIQPNINNINNNSSVTPVTPVTEIKIPNINKKINRKTIKLGKVKNKKIVSILIPSKNDKLRYDNYRRSLKQNNINKIKKYLKKRGLIKAGCIAPKNIIREIYESSILTGDIYNNSKDALIHNFMSID